MIATIIWLIVSLVVILVGAEILVDGSSSLARRLGMSQLEVGLTVVAFGTSTPELVISIISSFHGVTQLAVGNVVGSNIFNILAIIGLTALIRPLRVQPSVMSSQMPIMVLSAMIMLMLGNSVFLDGTAVNLISRTSGIFLLILFVLFMIYTVLTTRVPKLANLPSGMHQPMKAKTVEESEGAPMMPLWRQITYIIVGLAGLIWGGDRFVDSASDLARHLGMSEALIGLTVVACGTSLPEMATSVVAAIKGNAGLAVGNIIGSNIFNVSLVLGAAATVAPLSMGTIGNIDLFVLAGASLLFWLMGKVWGDHVINRPEGGILLAGYIAYTGWLISGI